MLLPIGSLETLTCDRCPGMEKRRAGDSRNQAEKFTNIGQSPGLPSLPTDAYMIRECEEVVCKRSELRTISPVVVCVIPIHFTDVEIQFPVCLSSPAVRSSHAISESLHNVISVSHWAS